jgi:glutamate-5-semialdehyde dehydrogenase
MRNVAGLPSPLGKILEKRTLYNKLELTKITVPFGVIGIIYEARPNVSFDVFSLVLNQAMPVFLKGGTDAYNSNLAIVTEIKSVLKTIQYR